MSTRRQGMGTWPSTKGVTMTLSLAVKVVVPSQLIDTSLKAGSLTQCRFVVKGASHLQQPPFKLLKPRFKSWSSYGPLDQKRSLLTSNVVRSMGYTMPTVCDTAVVLHALQLIQVLLASGYPFRFTIQTVSKFNLASKLSAHTITCAS